MANQPHPGHVPLPETAGRKWSGLNHWFHLKKPQQKFQQTPGTHPIAPKYKYEKDFQQKNIYLGYVGVFLGQ